MNRRQWLQGLGAVIIGMQVPLALAKERFTGPPWRHRLPMPTTLEELGPAIERLFPGGVLESTRAYDEFGLVGLQPFGLAPDNYTGPIQRCIHQTFALAYVVQDEQTKNGRLEVALVRCLYQTIMMIADRPENHGATLIWRRKPEGAIGEDEHCSDLIMTEEQWEDANKPNLPGAFHSWHGGWYKTGRVWNVRQIRMRLSLKQNGWRERLFVKPNMESSLVKKEGAAAMVIS